MCVCEIQHTLVYVHCRAAASGDDDDGGGGAGGAGDWSQRLL